MGFSCCCHCRNDLRVLYNLACCYSKLGKAEEAIDCLEQQASRSPIYVAQVAAWMKQDSDLDSLRNYRRYSALADRLEAQLPATRN